MLSQLSYTPTGLQGFRYASVFLEVLIQTLKIKQHLPKSLPLVLTRVRTDYSICSCLLRKEVIQPHLPIRLPCYDFTPITTPTLGGALLAVRLPTLGVRSSHGVTGGVYKARERIHRGMLIRDY